MPYFHMLFSLVLLQFHKVLLLASPPGNPCLPPPASLCSASISQLPQQRYLPCFCPTCFGFGDGERREYLTLYPSIVSTKHSTLVPPTVLFRKEWLRIWTPAHILVGYQHSRADT